MFAVKFQSPRDTVIFPKAIFAPIVKQAKERAPLITFLLKTVFLLRVFSLLFLYLSLFPFSLHLHNSNKLLQKLLLYKQDFFQK